MKEMREQLNDPIYLLLRTTLINNQLISSSLTLLKTISHHILKHHILAPQLLIQVEGFLNSFIFIIWILDRFKKHDDNHFA